MTHECTHIIHAHMHIIHMCTQQKLQTFTWAKETIQFWNLVSVMSFTVT